ncbi:MAG: hypothetical protein PHR45_00370 [Muribaculaceae bacterium]|nr:hypothetical protein [Muribaculaceae bacterium]
MKKFIKQILYKIRRNLAIKVQLFFFLSFILIDFFSSVFIYSWGYSTFYDFSRFIGLFLLSAPLSTAIIIAVLQEAY